MFKHLLHRNANKPSDLITVREKTLPSLKVMEKAISYQLRFSIIFYLIYLSAWNDAFISYSLQKPELFHLINVQLFQFTDGDKIP